MRIQKNKSSSSLLLIMIFFSALLIVYGVFRIFSFGPVMVVDDRVKQFFGSTIMSISKNTKNVKSSFFSFLKSPYLQKEIDRLSYDIRLLKVQNSILQNQNEENKRLKSLLSLISQKDYSIVPCDIWTRDLDNEQNFTINKGKKDQLILGQGIIYPLSFDNNQEIMFQLIGRIQELNQNSSRVLSIMDKRSKISCRNLRTLALGNVGYDEKKKELYVMTLTENDDYAINDVIVTSDLSTLPKNIVIGIVQRIDPTKTISKRIILRTSVDFLKVTTVASIK